jgi:hypothetical protein
MSDDRKPLTEGDITKMKIATLLATPFFDNMAKHVQIELAAVEPLLVLVGAQDIHPHNPFLHDSYMHVVDLGSGPGIGKSAVLESAAEREMREELGYGRGLMGLGYNGMGVYNYMEDRFHSYSRFDYPVLQDEKKLPEWQQRRNRSKDAKQALIDKLKAKGK